MNKLFKGKAIYQPAGKAAEYSKWAVNFYNGCSGKCTYCYNRTGKFAGILGGDIPTLKKCLVDEDKALEIFIKELNANLPELKKHGLHFNFVSDPFLPETIELNWDGEEWMDYLLSKHDYSDAITHWMPLPKPPTRSSG